MKKTYTLSKIAAPIIILGLLVIGPSFAHAEAKCVFTTTLELGSVGEDVRCLQLFLNSVGFVIADIGPGSPGKETDTFGERTKETLKKWQTARSIYPATGNFGPMSKAAYEASFITAAPVTVPSAITVVPPLGTASVVDAVTPTPAPVASNSAERKAKDLIKKVREAMENADDDIDDAEDDGEDVADPKNRLEKARDKFLDAVYAYFDGDYSEATSFATKAQDYIKDAVEDISGGSQDAEDAIADAKDAMAKARAEISDAEDDDDDTDEAQDLYDEAKDKYDEAREKFDDEDYSEAEDLAKEAEDLFDDAVDAL